MRRDARAIQKRVRSTELLAAELDGAAGDTCAQLVDHVGGAGLYLLSDLSARVSGEIHHVDGGYNIIGLPRQSELPASQPENGGES